MSPGRTHEPPAPPVSIQVRDIVEPLSRSSLTMPSYIQTISSDASRLLVRDMGRYCSGTLTGRSFLISGHRGAGKTTLVTGTVLQVLREPIPDMRGAQPLLVTLHGPSLFPPEPKPVEPVTAASPTTDPTPQSVPIVPGAPATPAAPAAPSNAVTASTTAAAAPPKRDEAGNALLQMILELHRAAARAFAQAYRAAVLERPWPAREEGLELAAQLELELFEPLSGDPARLREFWRRGGFLPEGVLPPAQRDQGWRELLALAGLWQAYRRIAGEFSATQSRKARASARQKISAASAEGKDLSNTILTLLTGGLVGAGLNAGGTPPAAATVLGILSAIGTSLSLKLSASRAISRSETSDSTFIPDFRAETLDRVLPVLIERLRDAGLFPVFLVDELDKVPNLSDRILPLVHHLKKLVAERAFFCFLTDRDYFEEMQLRDRQASYSVEYTYFTDRLFVTFAPEDLHAYVKMRLEAPPEPASGDASPEAKRAVAVRRDYPFIGYVVLHRSRMHALDVQRQIGSLDKTGGIIERPGLVRTDRAYLLDLVIQLALEVVLDDEELRASLSWDPARRRLVYDALYYISRSWDVDEELNLDDDAGMRKFAKYLAERTGSKQEISFSDDANFLLGKVRSLAALISRSAAFTTAVSSYTQRLKTRSGDVREEDGLANEILEAVNLCDDKAMPLEEVGGQPFRYRWRWDRDGRRATPREEAGATRRIARPAPADWQSDVAFINAVDRVLGVLGQ